MNLTITTSPKTLTVVNKNGTRVTLQYSNGDFILHTSANGGELKDAQSIGNKVKNLLQNIENKRLAYTDRIKAVAKALTATESDTFKKLLNRI